MVPTGFSRTYPAVASRSPRAQQQPSGGKGPTRQKGAWPWDRKLKLWLADKHLSLNAFSKRHGFAQSTLHSWMYQGVAVPLEGIQRIAAATNLPAEFWVDETIPFGDYADHRGEVWEVVKMLRRRSIGSLRDFREILANDAELEKALALWRASKGLPPPSSR